MQSAVPLVLLALLPSASVAPAHEQPATLGVHLALHTAPDLKLAVQVTVEGDQDGETVLSVAEDWGGVPRDRIDLVDASAADTDGVALTVTQDSNLQWTVQHAPGASFTLTTWLLPTDLRASGDSRDHYRPILEPELFQAVGQLLLPSPLVQRESQAESQNASDDRFALSLSFSGFEEAGWSLAHSFGLGFAPVEVNESRSRIASMLFTAGKLQVGTREIRGGQIALALDSTPWKFRSEDFTELAAEIINMEREALDDDGSEFYLVSVIRVGPDSQQGYSLGGTGLTNSFALYIQSNAVIHADSPLGPQIRKLLAHECFHEWNGQRIRLVYPDGEHTWFSEGFTEYFARRLLYADELLPGTQYLKWINESLLEYHRSSVRNLPSKELAKIFWTSREGQQQPYLRGELVAMLVEHGIRQHTGGDATLRDFMRSLLEEVNANPDLRFDTEGLLARLTEFTGPGLIPTLRAICVEGATVELPADVLGSGFVLETTTTHEYAAGFDTTASIPALEVIGLVEGSAADLAGLREGDEILGLSIERGRSDVPISMTVRSGPRADPRQVSYLPQGVEIRVPQFRKSDG